MAGIGVHDSGTGVHDQRNTQIPAQAEENDVVFEPTSGKYRIPFSFAMCDIPLSPIPLGCLHQNPPCVCIKEPTEVLTIKIDEKAYKAIEQMAGGGLIGNQAARILAAYACIP